jgi:DNA modification methylase
MSYPITVNSKYDFAGQSYADCYPNLHKYPATMLPQIGVEILRELNITSGKMLDPYCGSGSSFASAIDVGIHSLTGYDINPLARLITSAKYTHLEMKQINQAKRDLYEQVYAHPKNQMDVFLPPITNREYWFSEDVLLDLGIIYHYITQLEQSLYQLFLVPFSETLRQVSYTRDNEFKLYRIPADKITEFHPNVFLVYFRKLEGVIQTYKTHYLPKLEHVELKVYADDLPQIENTYDVILTSPPYGDSKTTVAYGQFSMFINEWLGFKEARQLDNLMMGGKRLEDWQVSESLQASISHLFNDSVKRAQEVMAFYHDLAQSITKLSTMLKSGGKAIFVVGNRTVKGIQLPTDQFIAEQFSQAGYRHLFTYERNLSNKVMPSRNSPTNQTGQTMNTMLKEYIVVCERS